MSGKLALVSGAMMIAVGLTSASANCRRCICARPALKAEEAAAVFVGTVLDRSMWSDSTTFTIDVTFLLEEMWTGTVRDTVRIVSELSGDCGTPFFVGHTYVVVAGTKEGDLYLRICDIAATLGSERADSVRKELNEPQWKAGPLRSREILNSAPGDGIDTVWVAGRVLRADRTPVAGARVSLPSIGHSATTDARGSFRFPSVPSGPYLVTVTTREGRQVDSLLLARCDPQWMRWQGTCAAFSRAVVVDSKL